MSCKDRPAPINVRRELQAEIYSLLDATGLFWGIRDGSRHHMVYLDGKMIAVLSKDKNSTQRDSRQLRSAIRRRMREIGAENSTDNGRAV